MTRSEQNDNPYGECGDTGENGEMTTHLLTGELSIHRSGSMKPPPTPTVEAVLTRGRLVRQETIKSNQDESFQNHGQEGTVHTCKSPDERPKSKDDLDLMRKPSMANQQPFPTITITILQPSSPPSSPPIPGRPGGASGSNGTSNTYMHQSSVISSGRRASISSLCHTGPFPDNKSKHSGSGGSSSVEVEEGKPQRSKSDDDNFELISFEEEIFEKYFYGREHWNYFTNDEALGPVIMSLKQETLGNRDQFRLLLRTISYSLHGMVPTSAICADRYDREAVVRALGELLIITFRI